MALDKVVIANMALGHLGDDNTIENLSTEVTPQANQANIWYDLSRQQALEAFNWTFAKKEVTLALHGDAPPSRWAFRYIYPADCIKMRWIINPMGEDADAIPYEVAVSLNGSTKTILTNQELAEVVYTFDQSLVALFSPQFIGAVSRLLASRMAPALTRGGKQDIELKQFQLYQAIVSGASASDANEGVGTEPRDPDWIRLR